MVELSEDDKKTVGRARRIHRFMSQPFAVAEQFTGIPGKYVKLEETINSFERLVAGDFDHLPEQAFFMAGGIADLGEDAKKLSGWLGSTSRSTRRRPCPSRAPQSPLWGPRLVEEAGTSPVQYPWARRS